MSYLVKHNGKETYFLGGVNLGTRWAMTFTNDKRDAKRYTSKESAQREIDRFQDAEYIVVPEYGQ